MPSKSITINEVQAKLVPWEGVHPRLFLQADDVGVLRTKITGGKYHYLWNTIYAEALKEAARKPPPFKDRGDQRGYGDKLADMAFCYLLSHNRTLLAGAVKWATVLCQYPTWVEHVSNIGLNYGHDLLGLAMLYDYAYWDLNPTTRNLIYQTLLKRGHEDYQRIATGSTGTCYVSNLLMVQELGPLAAALATFDQPDSSDVLDWIAWTETSYAISQVMLSPDGAGIEGPAYTRYAMSFYFLGLQLSDQLLGLDYFHDEKSSAANWGARVGSYFIRFLLPRNSWRVNTTEPAAKTTDHNFVAAVPFEDCFLDTSPPVSALRGVASFFKNGYAQWFADQWDRVPGYKNAGWENLLWYDDTVIATPPIDLPTLHVFENLGIVSSRTDWSGDEAVLTFKCGGPGGLDLPTNFADFFNQLHTNPGLFHVHPDEGSFSLFANGEWLITEPGYAPHSTNYENTLLVDGNGQSGETRRSVVQGACFNPLTTNLPSLTYVNSSSAQDTMVGEIAPIYAPKVGVKSFQRHLLFIKPNILLVGDNIHMDSHQHRLDLFFHLGTTEFTALSSASLLAQMPKTRVQIDLLTPNDSTLSTSLQDLDSRQKAKKPRLVGVVDITAKGQANWRNVVVFSWAANEAAPPKITLLSSQGDNWQFQVGSSQIITLDWQSSPSL